MTTVDEAREALLSDFDPCNLEARRIHTEVFEAAIRAEDEEPPVDVFEHPSLGVAEIYRAGPPPSHYTAMGHETARSFRQGLEQGRAESAATLAALREAYDLECTDDRTALNTRYARLMHAVHGALAATPAEATRYYRCDGDGGTWHVNCEHV